MQGSELYRRLERSCLCLIKVLRCYKTLSCLCNINKYKIISMDLMPKNPGFVLAAKYECSRFRFMRNVSVNLCIFINYYIL
jgi:hypothetical protein